MSQFDQRGQHVERDQYIAGRDQYVAKRDIIIQQASAEPEINVEEAEETYRQQVVTVYNRLNFGGLGYRELFLSEVPLEGIFIHLRLKKERIIREPVQREESSKAKQRPSQQWKLVTVYEPTPLELALRDHVLILGESGSGKSTLLRWLAVTFARGNQREQDRLGPSARPDLLPILVNLGQLQSSQELPNWLEFLPTYPGKQMGFKNTPPQLVEKALKEGRCLLLFDGLDEVADIQARIRIALSLAELAHLPSNNQKGNLVVIGSRPAGVSGSENTLHPLFQHCDIARFNQRDIQQFFYAWYALDQDLTPQQQRADADELYMKIEGTPTQKLAETPLLCTILLLLWRNKRTLPKRRVDLYEQCCRVLLEQWERYHTLSSPNPFPQLPWEERLSILSRLGYFVHTQQQLDAQQQQLSEQPLGLRRQDLFPELRKLLQQKGVNQDQIEQFIAQSGLLQYLGSDQYGFPHHTFQEYLAARYIAAQPDPEYIDLVMAHLHEAWWQEVHLLTIAHLGSGNMGDRKASALILTILHVYAPPSWILRSSRNRWLRLVGPGKLFPQVQLERRIAWILAREFELAIKGYAECVLDGTTAKVRAVLSAQVVSFVRRLIYDGTRLDEQGALLPVIWQLLQRQGNEAVVSALLQALHNPDREVRRQAAASLGQVGVGSEAVVSALLEALHDPAWDGVEVRRQAAKSLGQVGVGNEAVVSTLVAALHDPDVNVREQAAASLDRMGVGSEAVVSALLAALHNPDKEVREQAAASLGQVGVGNEAVVSALLEALHDPDWYVRGQAAASLGQMGVGSEAVVSTLLEALYDPDRNMQRKAADLLGQVGVGNEAVVSALLAALHDAKSIRRQWGVADLLGQVGVDNEAVVSALLAALHDPNWDVRAQAAKSLGQMGVSNEAVVSTLVALHDPDRDTKMPAPIRNPWIVRRAAASLGKLKIKDKFQLRRVLAALNHCLHSWDSSVRQLALLSIQQLLDGQPIPDYRWVPLWKRRARRLQLKRIAFWLGMFAIMMMIGLAATWLLGALDPNGFPMHFLAVSVGIVAFVASIVQVLGRTLRDPWEPS